MKKCTTVQRDGQNVPLFRPKVATALDARPCGRKGAWSGSCAGTLARAFPCEHGPSALDAEPTRRRRVWKVAEPASDPQAGAFEDHDRVARKSVLAHAGQ